jgi:hypothetical protein
VTPKSPPVDINRKRNRDEDEDSNFDNSGAKKQAVNNSGAKKLATDSKATEARLVKFIESLADDLDARVTPTKGDFDPDVGKTMYGKVLRSNGRWCRECCNNNKI